MDEKGKQDGRRASIIFLMGMTTIPQLIGENKAL